MEERRNKPEVLIKDLVSSFLIPDVQRKKLQRQRKCLLLISLIIYSPIRGEKVLGDCKEDHSEFSRLGQLEARDGEYHQKVMSKFNYLKMD